MKTLKDFTPEIQAKIPSYIQNALKGIFDGEKYRNFNLIAAENAVNWNYEKCGLKKPIVIVAENPFEQQIIFNYLKTAKHLHPIIKMLYEMKNDGIQLTSQLTSQLGSQLTSQLRSQLGSQLYSQLDSQLDSQLNSQLRSQLDNQQDNKELTKYNDSYLFTLNVFSYYYFTWFKFIKDEFKLQLTIEKEFEECSKLQKESNIYSMIPSELFCVVSKYPKLINRNENNDLHNTKDVAVEWGHLTDFTKFNCYYINGRNIDSNLFVKALNRKITMNDFINELNEDNKAAIYEIIGEQEMMTLLDTEIIDAVTIVHNNGDLEELILIKTKTTFPEIDNKPLAWIKFKCPSTGSNYHISTNPDFNMALDAAKFHRPFNDLNKTEYSWNFRS